MYKKKYYKYKSKCSKLTKESGMASNDPDKGDGQNEDVLDPIPDEELDLVRNYMLGSLLGSLENAFSHADKFKNLYFSGLDYGYYERYIQTVKNISSDELRRLAHVYLNSQDFTKVVAGKK